MITLPGIATLRRTITIKPAMCGHNALFIGQIGDWTWDTVNALCGVDTFSARDADGSPAYLAFYYIRLRSRLLNWRALTFGDQLTVLSSSYNFGSRSILTLHRIACTGSRYTQLDTIHPAEFYDHPRPDVIYVESFNRWITRKLTGSNTDLVHSTPPDFRHDHLGTLPDRYSPRLVCQYAKSQRTFHDPSASDGYAAVCELTIDYAIDVTRDLNGVGLVYFASYFSIVDRALWALWRHLGRDERAYLATGFTDQQMCLYGNVDVGATLTLCATLLRSEHKPTSEIVNVVVTEKGTGRLIAVCTLKTRLGVDRVRHAVANVWSGEEQEHCHG